MKQYQDILKEVLKDGIERTNRTNLKDYFIPSATMKVDLRDGFPALTTKQLYYKQSIGEILGFIRGYESASDFRALGCNIWNSDANENKTWLNSPYRKGEDDLGKIYGSTWRSRLVHKDITKTVIGNLNGQKYGQHKQCCGLETHLQSESYYCSTPNFLAEKYDHLIYSKEIDQLRDAVDTIINNPNNRRIIMHAWFPELFDEMALPPCHCLYRFIPDEKNNILHMTMFQRSCDLLLGVPMNLFGSGLLLSLIAKATGYTAGTFTHQMADVHLYENQLDAARAQLEREPLSLSGIRFTKPIANRTTTEEAMTWLETIEPSDIDLIGYEHQGALPKVEMAQEK